MIPSSGLAAGDGDGAVAGIREGPTGNEFCSWNDPDAREVVAEEAQPLGTERHSGLGDSSDIQMKIAIVK